AAAIVPRRPCTAPPASCDRIELDLAARSGWLDDPSTDYRPGMLSAVPHAPGRHVTVNGTRLWIEEEGTGSPLVLLAGGPANSHVCFHPVFSDLADRARMIYFDYRWRGRSD